MSPTCTEPVWIRGSALAVSSRIVAWSCTARRPWAWDLALQGCRSRKLSRMKVTTGVGSSSPWGWWPTPGLWITWI